MSLGSRPPGAHGTTAGSATLQALYHNLKPQPKYDQFIIGEAKNASDYETSLAGAPGKLAARRARNCGGLSYSAGAWPRRRAEPGQVPHILTPSCALNWQRRTAPQKIPNRTAGKPLHRRHGADLVLRPKRQSTRKRAINTTSHILTPTCALNWQRRTAPQKIPNRTAGKLLHRRQGADRVLRPTRQSTRKRAIKTTSHILTPTCALNWQRRTAPQKNTQSYRR